MKTGMLGTCPCTQSLVVLDEWSSSGKASSGRFDIKPLHHADSILTLADSKEISRNYK